MMGLVGEDAGLTEAILGCAFRVHGTLGHGFLEKVYENAMVHELRKAGHRVEAQCPLRVSYDGVVVGEYSADLLVEARIIVELKAARGLEDIHVAQTLNYLKATATRTALLLNFGAQSLQIKRLVLNP